MEHLVDKARERLALPDEERIRSLRAQRWIGYGRAADILHRFDALLHHPKVDRMPNVLLVGPTNNGKTSILRHFTESHPPDDNAGGDAALVPVLLVQSPPTPDEAALYDKILENFALPIRPRDHARNKRFQVIQILGRVGTKVLIIDEVQDLLAGDSIKTHAILNVIKHLGNELRIPIVAAGVQKAFNALQIDAQLANRFHPLPLPRWTLNDDFRRLLASFERLIPLRQPSGLAGLKLAETILVMGEGVIGETAELLAQAAEWAIHHGTERIDLRALQSIGWGPPSERHRKAGLAVE